MKQKRQWGKEPRQRGQRGQVLRGVGYIHPRDDQLSCADGRGLPHLGGITKLVNGATAAFFGRPERTSQVQRRTVIAVTNEARPDVARSREELQRVRPGQVVGNDCAPPSPRILSAAEAALPQTPRLAACRGQGVGRNSRGRPARHPIGDRRMGGPPQKAPPPQDQVGCDGRASAKS
jgi:hypothetical protein